MKNIILSISLFTLLAACSAVKTVDDKGRPLPLARKYTAGERMKYKLKLDYFENDRLKYSSEARAIVRVSTNAVGTFYEEFKWISLKRSGKEVKLSPESRAFTQHLSLDPAFNLSIPNLSGVLPLVEPITDTLTFYADLQLAIKKAMVLKVGEKMSVYHGEPNSWAGGPVKLGQDCVDFELTMAKIGRNYAVLKVLHFPPGRVCGEPPAPWMKRNRNAAFNNWYQVMSEGDGNYTAGYAVETFDDEIKISLPDGKILSATQTNILEGQERFCVDPGLNSCQSPKDFSIRRQLFFSAE